MPYLVTCPKCATQLKSTRPVAAGRALTCPQCKTNFTLTAPAPEIDLPSAPAARPAARPAPVPPPVAARSEPTPVRPEDDVRPRGRRREEEVEEDRPRSRRRADQEEDRPRSRRNADEEDARPRGKSRPVEDDEVDRPKSRKRRDDDDEEDSPPRSRAARDDDEEDHDDRRPRSRGGRKKKGNKRLLLFGALAALFLFCAGGGLTLYLADPFGWFGGGSSEMLAWVPSEMQAVEGADVEAVSKNTTIMNGLRQKVAGAEAAGMKAEEMSSYLVGKRTPNGGGEVIVVKLKSSADKDKIIKAVGGQEVTAAGKKYYRMKDNGGLYFASDKMVVLTKTENSLSTMLARDSSKVAVSDDLKAAVKRADGHLWMASVVSDAGMFGGMGKGGPAAPPAPKAMVMNATLTSSGDVNLKLELTFADSDSAKLAQTAMEAQFNALKNLNVGAILKGPEGQKIQDLKRMFESAKITQSGNTVTITMTGPPDGMSGFGMTGGFGK